ncbi:MAG: hypothetical protein JSS72_06975 [Armatimonadetes bacterium]|nr:hypothetical protein [Armatimonadota bacterium]
MDRSKPVKAALEITGKAANWLKGSLAGDPYRTDPELIQTRQEELLRFFRNFEDLVDVIQMSDELGEDERLGIAYKVCQKRFDANYGCIQPYVVAYLRYSSTDAAMGLRYRGLGTDAFEALVVSPTLWELLANDRDDLNWRIQRCREALTLYSEHLKQLLRTGNES